VVTFVSLACAGKSAFAQRQSIIPFLCSIYFEIKLEDTACS